MEPQESATPEEKPCSCVRPMMCWQCNGFGRAMEDDDEGEAKPSGAQSPYRFKSDAWGALKRELGLTERDTAAPRASTRQTTPRPRFRSATEAPLDEVHASDPWYFALRRVGRLGKSMGDGKYAVLCPNDAQHTTPPPDGSAENASGSCVLLPPVNGSRFGRPFCAHGHCKEKLSLREWVMAVGVEVYADAWAEAMGWRQAEGFLLTPHGVFEAKRLPLRLPERAPTPTEAEPPSVDLECDDSGKAAKEEPFWWGMGDRLANFAPRILANITEHDADSTRRFYDIEAVVDGQVARLRVPVTEFASLSWVPQLGSDAVIEPGRDTKDRLRAAIQHLSRPAARRDVFAVTGWREIGGEQVYLHAGGALGASGPVEGIEVRLNDPVLARFSLPAPLEGDALRAGAEACAALFLLNGALEVTVPLFGAVWRSTLGPSPLTVYVSGPPTSGKTMLVALGQSHFGATMDERHLPASLKHATAASLNKMRAVIGDAVFVADDYLMSGTSDDMKLNEKVDVMVRAQYGGAGARRLGRDGALARTESEPRSLAILTGESLPRGHSLRTRLVVGELAGPLSEDLAQRKAMARAGLYAGTMAAFLKWLAPQLKTIQAELPERIAKVVDRLDAGNARRDQRTLALLSEVAVGVRLFLDFAAYAGVPAEARERIREATWAMLRASTERQRSHQESQEPAQRFLGILFDGLRGFRWYFTRPDGTAPEDCGAWGWFIPTSRAPGQTEEGDPIEPQYITRGACVGVVDAGEVWINTKLALAEAQKLAREIADPLPLTPDDLGKRLYDLGLLARTDIKTRRRTYQHRKRLKLGKILDGLCVSVDTLQGVRAGDSVSTASAVTDGENTEKLN
jgi:hypothetical protein